ncbi:ABC transporter permease [Intrasporangium oryzae NRRL B-24470]|uniref:ABC transporter permease n=1 Tax=Intrasporangium oryzae NRRL B-24470 TaxID=1386089 RepID=W9GI59_9MICO|nr:ABC-2 family transporter protein [Intrasporangium oryzae]EWT03549.1 ABC transporter permease [Intrasporangium oryzae NRRL B-24470]
MTPFWILTRAGFRRHSTYRLALLAGMTTNSVFGVIRALLLLAALASAGSDIGGYDAPTAVAFVWWGQALLGTVNLWGFQEVKDRVRTGDIAIDFLRPVNPQLAYLAGDLGRAGINLVGRGAPAILLGGLLFDMAWPPGAASWVSGAVSVVLAVVVAFSGNFTVNLLAFWLVEIRGIYLMWMITGGLLCGLYLPVPWFPNWLRTIAEWSPFPSMLQIPIDILAGRVVGAEIIATMATQVFWATALLVLGQVVLRAGRRRLEVQGG